MADEPRKTVGQYVSLQRGTTYSGKLVGEPGPALLGLGSIEPGGGFRANHYKTFGGECPTKLMLVPGDIYVALKGATKDGSMVGSVARLPEGVPSGRLTQDTARLDFFQRDPQTVSHLYWVLRTPQYREYCAGRLTGSAAASFSREDFLSFPVPPVSATSKAIIGALDAIETKIELNRRMNETLEAMARALFKSWFVDFDPVRAKAEGRQTGLPREIDALFPDRFEESEIGEVPDGWGITSISELAEVVGGSTPSTQEPAYWEEGNHHWATPKDLAGLASPVLLDTERKITDAGLAQIGSGLLPKGTVLLSSRAPIGYLAIAQISTAINQGFIAMLPKSGVSNLFLLLWAEMAHAEIVSRANGSTFLEISKSNFRPIPVVHPPAALMRPFENLAQSFFARIVLAEGESLALRAIRDALLPKLVTGERAAPLPRTIVGV